MKKDILADTGVFFKYFNGDHNAKELIEKKKNEIFTLELNLAELIYLVGRKFGLETSLLRENILRNSFTVVLITLVLGFY
ncbi:PIN domain-containing protein [Acidianus sp. RZ1]|uniref:PIN domain-containing protein n=1 Tax=Acidianus sp. RZ1 TaxID=1540082 RepID=UPI001491BBC2|nr:PIN domain-containing protein [Acidianus sp. RZ1]NON61359.1 PIN domain-containing protein [Acidianus sp. RZ1]